MKQRHVCHGESEPTEEERRAPRRALVRVPRECVSLSESPPDDIRQSVPAAHERQRGDPLRRVSPPHGRDREEDERVYEGSAEEFRLAPLARHRAHRVFVPDHPGADGEESNRLDGGDGGGVVSRLGGRAEQRPRQHEERAAGGVNHLTAQCAFENVVGREDIEQFHPEVRGDGGTRRRAGVSRGGHPENRVEGFHHRNRAGGRGRARRRGAAMERGRGGRERGRGGRERGRGITATRRDARRRGASRTRGAVESDGTRDDGSTGNVADPRGTGARADGDGGDDDDAISRERRATRGEVAGLGRRRDGGARRSDGRDDGCHQPIGASRGRRRAMGRGGAGRPGRRIDPSDPSDAMPTETRERNRRRAPDARPRRRRLRVGRTEPPAVSSSERPPGQHSRSSEMSDRDIAATRRSDVAPHNVSGARR